MPGDKTKTPSTSGRELLKKVRKPMPPPAKVEEDVRKYNRARERQRQRKGQ